MFLQITLTWILLALNLFDIFLDMDRAEQDQGKKVKRKERKKEANEC
jgi:hypothetical protein